MLTLFPKIIFTVLGVVSAAIAAELILESTKWAPTSIGATDGLKIIFTTDTIYQNDSTTHLEVDRDFGRRTGRETRVDTSLPQILFYGDSMTFGAGVTAEETFSAKIQSSLGRGVVVKNFGVIGYGPDQATKLALRSVPVDTNVIGVLTLFPGNDFKDLSSNKLITCMDEVCSWSTTHILSPFLSHYRLMNLIRGGIFGKEAIPPSVITELFNDSETSFNTINEEERKRTEAQLKFALEEFSRIFSIERTVIVVIPPFSATNSPTESTTQSHRIAETIAVRLGLKTVPLLHSLQTTSYLPNDHHLNASGHQIVSDALIPELKSILSDVMQGPARK